jgi:Xaa-Pro aminopeptidase
MKKSGYNFSVAVTPHSIGLSHTDEPGKNGPGSFWQKDDLILQENMIISVDLPVLNTGIGGTAHLEDLTLITNDGGEQINDIGNRIIVL